LSSKLPISLENLLRQRQVEGERIEYKAGWNPDAILRTICAFANDFENLSGGYVIIGQDCDSDGKPIFPPIGVPENQHDKIQQELQTCCNLIQPSYFPHLSIELYEEKFLFILWVPGGSSRPYKAPRAVTAKNKEYHYYIRRYSSTVEAKGEDERQLISLTAQIPYDDRVNQSAKVTDLSHRLVAEFLREVESRLAEDAASMSIETLGRQLNIVAGSTEAPLPKNVGLLFFNEHPERFFPATQIDIVWFPEDSGGDRLEEKEFKGPLGQITRDSIRYIERNYLKEIVLKHPDRPQAERFWNFPLAAIEEAIVNAVYHRSYEIREPVEIRITRKDLVVLSYPGPDRSIQLKDLQAGRAISRRYRNRRIGEFLKELSLCEARATGISKIIKAMARNGSTAPEFETDEDRSYFIVRLPIHPKVTGDISGEVARLIEAGLLEMTIPEKPQTSKYRLTALGKQWLSSLSTKPPL
jgi:ATP-dependent DNA helicase RecG